MRLADTRVPESGKVTLAVRGSRLTHWSSCRSTCDFGLWLGSISGGCFSGAPQ